MVGCRVDRRDMARIALLADVSFDSVSRYLARRVRPFKNVTAERQRISATLRSLGRSDLVRLT